MKIRKMVLAGLTLAALVGGGGYLATPALARSTTDGRDPSAISMRDVQQMAEDILKEPLGTVDTIAFVALADRADRDVSTVLVVVESPAPEITLGELADKAGAPVDGVAYMLDFSKGMGFIVYTQGGKIKIKTKNCTFTVQPDGSWDEDCNYPA